MKREAFEVVLSIISEVLPEEKCIWALTGGASLFARRIINDTTDIDILMTKECTALAADGLGKYMLNNFSFSEECKIKSFFGKFQIEGVLVEIMAEVFNKSDTGEWNPHTEWLQHIETVKIRQFFVPMLSLKYESQLNATLGNSTRVGIIDNYLSNLERIKYEQSDSAEE